MRLFEYQGKDILKKAGIPVASGKVVTTARDAVAAAGEIGLPVVVKAQVLAGGRGKAGGVKIAKTSDEVLRYATAILGMTIKGEVCRELLIDPMTDIKTELYAGVTLDSIAGAPLLMFSLRGGMDIEEVAASAPQDVLRMHFSVRSPLPQYKVLDLLAGLELDATLKLKIAQVIVALSRAFLDGDCTTLEINPLVVTGQGEVMALDAKAVIDDNALRRQPYRCEAEAGHRAGKARPGNRRELRAPGGRRCRAGGRSWPGHGHHGHGQLHHPHHGQLPGHRRGHLGRAHRRGPAHLHDHPRASRARSSTSSAASTTARPSPGA
jgi:succinyl-CoA synthetase beta subunit